MIVEPGNAQNVGARTSQQDAFGFSEKDDQHFVSHGGVLAVLADGMGGLANGGEASHLAVREFLATYMAKTPEVSIPDALLEALNKANNAVFQLAKDTKQEDNTGTTLVAAVVHGETLYWIAAGDSRLYLCRQGRMTQINEDHLYAKELDRDVASGRISAEKALSHPERWALTSFLGQEKPEEIDRNIKPFSLEAGDRLLLCSDGLYPVLSERAMAEGLVGNAQLAAENLIQMVLAQERPGQDNATAVILTCE